MFEMIGMMDAAWRVRQTDPRPCGDGNGQDGPRGWWWREDFWSAVPLNQCARYPSGDHLHPLKRCSSAHARAGSPLSRKLQRNGGPTAGTAAAQAPGTAAAATESTQKKRPRPPKPPAQPPADRSATVPSTSHATVVSAVPLLHPSPLGHPVRPLSSHPFLHARRPEFVLLDRPSATSQSAVRLPSQGVPRNLPSSRIDPGTDAGPLTTKQRLTAPLWGVVIDRSSDEATSKPPLSAGPEGPRDPSPQPAPFQRHRRPCPARAPCRQHALGTLEAAHLPCRQ